MDVCPSCRDIYLAIIPQRGEAYVSDDEALVAAIGSASLAMGGLMDASAFFAPASEGKTGNEDEGRFSSGDIKDAT